MTRRPPACRDEADRAAVGADHQHEHEVQDDEDALDSWLTAPMPTSAPGRGHGQSRRRRSSRGRSGGGGDRAGRRGASRPGRGGPVRPCQRIDIAGMAAKRRRDEERHHVGHDDAAQPAPGSRVRRAAPPAAGRGWAQRPMPFAVASSSAARPRDERGRRRSRARPDCAAATRYTIHNWSGLPTASGRRRTACRTLATTRIRGGPSGRRAPAHLPTTSAGIARRRDRGRGQGRP